MSYLINPFISFPPPPSANLTNGAGFSISEDTGTRNTSSGSSNWMYDDNSFTATTAIKYYFNAGSGDSLIFTSSINSGTYYAVAESYDDNNGFKLTKTSTYVEWEITALGATPPNGTGLGADTAKTEPSSWDALDLQFAIDGNNYRIREGGVDKTSHISTTIGIGQKFKLVYA